MVYSQPPAVSASGTYTTANTTLMLEPDIGGSSTAVGYCVQGNTLHMREGAIVEIIPGMLGEVRSHTIATK
jgi:N-methylhydantoinase A/oxoprolinase/acetone carboxylase beta subunit